MPNTSLITIRDIAQQLGVSHSTVSRALHNSPLIAPAMRERVKTAAHRLGYIPNSAARAMRGEPSSLIGFVVPDVRPDFFSELTAEYGRACVALGNNLMLSVSQGDPAIEEAQIRALRSLRVAGVLIYPTADITETSVRLLADIPTVQIARKHPALDSHFVGSDDASSMAILVRHLVEIGHSKIAFVGSEARFSPGLDRLDAFRRTMAELKQQVDERMVCSTAATTAAGREAVASLLDLNPRPTALVVASAPLAEGGLDVLQTRSLGVPDDISLTSFGDPFWYRAWGGGITTVAMPIEGIVRQSLSLLLSDDDHNVGRGKQVRDVRLASKVIFRCSTSAPS